MDRKIALKPGEIYRVRWRHRPGFGKEAVILEGFGLATSEDCVSVSDGKHQKTLFIENFGYYWEAVPVKTEWVWRMEN